MGIVFDSAWKTSVPFPFDQKTLLYWGVAALVVHICHRLVEQTSSVSDPLGRRVSVSHAAMCIGCLVWALDVVGFFMYPESVMDGFRLSPALSALVMMTVAARLALPALCVSTQVIKVGLAGFGLSFGMVLGHVILTNGVALRLTKINLFALLAAIILALALSVGLALKHRVARLRAFVVEYRPFSWQVKILAGLGIVLLHWVLVNTFSGPFSSVAHAHGASSLTLLVSIMVFGMAVAADQLYNLHSEQSRQKFWSMALSRIRKTPSGSADPLANHQLSLISDRLPTLLTPACMQVFFQPIIKAGREGWHQEALLRIKDDCFGPIDPEVFFLACELKGVTAQVDRMIIGIALDHVCDWRRQGHMQTFISVNLAPETLLASDFPDWLAHNLQRRSLPANLLKLEMTEHGIIASGSKMLAALTALRTIGVGVVMDDFGVGYSSLGVLSALPIVGIKCDRLFVKDVHLNPRRQVLLKHIATLAHELGIMVTAEGVETSEELDMVLASDIHSIQGYYYSAAIAAAEIPAWHLAYLARRDSQGERRPTYQPIPSV